MNASDTPPHPPVIADGSIPFNRPSIQGDEMAYMQGAIEGGHSSAAGPYSELASAILRDETGAADVLLTTSCTAALEMAAMLLDLAPGDTVIVPSFTLRQHRARLRPRRAPACCSATSSRRRLGLDPAHLADARSTTRSARSWSSTTAASPATSTASATCWRTGPDVALVEDNAHGLFGRWRGRSRSAASAASPRLSFHETKNFVCGEGGALAPQRPRRRRPGPGPLRQGHQPPRVLARGDVDKYTWNDTGSSFGLSDVLAAYLLGQLEQRDGSSRASAAAVSSATPRGSPYAAPSSGSS